MTTSGNGSAGAPRAVGRPGPTWPGSGRSPVARAGRRDATGDATGARSTGPTGLTLASFRRRAIGFLIDGLLIGLLIVVLTAALGLSAANPTTESQVLVLLFRVAYNWVWNTLGWSPGKRVVGLRIVLGEGGPPGLTPGFGRSVVAIVSDLAFGVGYLWALWDPRHQTWHDKMAGTYVVLAPPVADRASGSPSSDARP